MNLATAFATSVKNNSKKTAVFYGDEEIFYSQLWDQTLFVSQQLQKLGVKAGDRVALWLKNCPQFIPALVGVWQAGGIVVPINNFLKPDEVTYILNDAGVDVIITDASMAEGCEKLKTNRPQLKFFQVEEIATAGNIAPQIPENTRTKGDLAVIIYTSGTTGRPKGAMLSHGNLWHNVESCRQVLRCVGSDRFVIVLPMFHSFMLTVGTLLPLLVGGSIVLVKSLHPAKNVITEIVQNNATILPAVPQFFRTLMHPSIPADLPLRLCISGGAPLPAEILREFTGKFSFPLVEGYGLSEASPVCTFNPLKQQKAGSIGKPIPDVELSVQDEEGKILPATQTGEICIRGENVMQGYWNQPEESAKTMRGDWLLTGDIGHQDTEGYFFITDRKKDMLLVNGINVYPREIEELIYKFNGVKEAAVVGIPDSRRGEMPLAFVSPNENATIDEKSLLQFLREKLADYKVPRRIVVLPALPRNATGKIVKTTLRDMAKQNAPQSAD